MSLESQVNLEALYALIAESNDEEYQVLIDLAVRAGLLWRCRCGDTTPASEDRCDGCDSKRS